MASKGSHSDSLPGKIRSTRTSKDEYKTTHFEFCDLCLDEGLRQIEEIQLRDGAITELRDEIGRLQNVIDSLKQTRPTSDNSFTLTP